MKTLVQLITVLVFALFPAQAAKVKFDDSLSEQEQSYALHLQKRVQNDAKAKLMATRRVMQDSPAAITLPGLGSRDRAIRDYAIPRAQLMAMGVYQNKPGGGYIEIGNQNGNIYVKTFEELNELMRSTLTNMIELFALTNTVIDRDKPLNVFAFTTTYHEDISWVNYMLISKPFNLAKSADGSYHVPDFSSYEMDLATTLVYALPGASYVRCDVQYNPLTSGKSNILHSIDSRVYASGSGPFEFSLEPRHEKLSISKGTAISGTNGLTFLKIWVTVPPTDRYTWGPMGEQLPFLSNFKVQDQQVTFNLTAEREKAYVVESAPEACGPWTYAGLVVIPDYSSTVTFQGNTCGPVGIFRIRHEEQP